MRIALAVLRRGLLADAPILLCLLAVWIVLLAVLTSKGVHGVSLNAYVANLALYLSALMFVFAFLIGAQLWRHRPGRPIGFLAASFRSSGLAQHLLRGTPMLLALVIFMPAFSAMKSAIPLFNGFTWDQTWIALDRSLHGGDPWRHLNAVMGHPVITSILSAFYQVWILLIYVGGVYFCFFQRDRVLRAQYLMAFFACWVLLGILAATAFASVGPCFLEPMLGDRTFAEQIATLRAANEQAPVFSLLVQDRLIDWYAANDNGLGRGISAMPSMHVSIAFLFFLAMRRVSRLAGILFGLFFAIILIGSVHLAYHYAVDGYFAIAGTYLIWLAAGPLARRISQTGAEK